VGYFEQANCHKACIWFVSAAIIGTLFNIFVVFLNNEQLPNYHSAVDVKESLSLN